MSATVFQQKDPGEKVFSWQSVPPLDCSDDAALTFVKKVLSPDSRVRRWNLCRAARNLNGRAILYADQTTDSMRRALDETSRRRERQIAHNLASGITPRSVVKKIRDLIDGVYSEKSAKDDLKRANQAAAVEALSERDLGKRIKQLEREMLEHARNLEFEKAARIRDQLTALREQAFGAAVPDQVVVSASTGASKS